MQNRKKILNDNIHNMKTFSQNYSMQQRSIQNRLHYTKQTEHEVSVPWLNLTHNWKQHVQNTGRLQVHWKYVSSSTYGQFSHTIWPRSECFKHAIVLLKVTPLSFQTTGNVRTPKWTKLLNSPTCKVFQTPPTARISTHRHPHPFR